MTAITDEELPYSQPLLKNHSFLYRQWIYMQSKWFLFMNLIIFITLLYRLWFERGGDLLSDLKCDQVLTKGFWMGSLTGSPLPINFWFKNIANEEPVFQPLHCTPKKYKESDLDQCFANKKISIIGDSTARRFFCNFINQRPDDTDASEELKEKCSYQKQWSGSEFVEWIDFHWDPYLDKTLPVFFQNETQPDMLIISNGFWFLKNMDFSEALNAWKERVALFWSELKARGPADTKIYISPVPFVNEALLSPNRKSITLEKTLAFNEVLKQSFEEHRYLPEARNVYYVENWFKIYEGTKSIGSNDGIHYHDWVLYQLTQLIFNHFCPPKTITASTCCVNYAPFNWKQIFFISLTFVFGPLALLLQLILPKLKWMPSFEQTVAVSLLAFCLLFVLLMDRTWLFVKYQKHYSSPAFFSLVLAILLIGWMTRVKVKPNQQTLFLSRYVTNEWKGWMQLLILIYHYTGASQISPIYNLMRILVASYIFMTGYGHVQYFYLKKDFGFARVCQVLIRLNLLSAALSWTMHSKFQQYYFSPLVSFFFLIIYVLMRISYLKNTELWWFIPLKLAGGILCMILFSVFDLWRPLMQLYSFVTGSQWQIKEWQFRVELDAFIVFYGMLIGFLWLKYKSLLESIWKNQLLFIEQRSLLIRSFGILGALLLLAYLYFEMSQDKFSYNIYHPFTSFVAISGYLLLRHLTYEDAQYYSLFFEHFGQISLETFILQFHLWLALDTRGLLILFQPPEYATELTVGGQWVLFAWTIVHFLVVGLFFWQWSVLMSEQTGVLTNWICQVLLPNHKMNGNGGSRDWKSLLVEYRYFIVVVGILCLFNHLSSS